MKIAVVTPSGDRLLIAAGNIVVGLQVAEPHAARIFRFEGSGDEPLVALDCSGRYLVGGYNSKHMCCWDLHTGEVLGSCLIKKRPTHVACGSFKLESTGSTKTASHWDGSGDGSGSREVVLAADRGGEVHAMGLPALETTLCVAGHTTSIVTDLLLTPHFMVTADRDEKIRVTHFPQASAIQSYCLGHTSVVAGLAGFSGGSGVGQMLVSCGWDHQVCLWAAEGGECVGNLRVGLAAGAGREEKGMGGGAAGVEAAAAGEGAKAAAPEQKGGACEEEEDDEEEKAYDEQLAGHYPIKVLAQTLPPSSTGADERVLLVLLFRGLAEVKTSIASRLAGAGTQTHYNFSPLISWPTAALPVDAAFLSCSAGGVKVAVVLPGPAYVRVVEVPHGAAAAAPGAGGPAGDHGSTCSTACASLCSAAQCELQACLPGGAALMQQSTLADTQDEGGRAALKKHSLDRPFNALTTGVDCNPQPGRRGRKRPLKAVAAGPGDGAGPPSDVI